MYRVRTVEVEIGELLGELVLAEVDELSGSCEQSLFILKYRSVVRLLGLCGKVSVYDSFDGIHPWHVGR